MFSTFYSFHEKTTLRCGQNISTILQFLSKSIQFFFKDKEPLSMTDTYENGHFLKKLTIHFFFGVIYSIISLYYARLRK